MDKTLLKHNINADISGHLKYSEFSGSDANLLISEYAVDTPQLQSLSFIPSTSCTWIICYNTDNESSHFYCIGVIDSIMNLTLDGYTNYIFMTFNDDTYYINNGISPASPAAFYNQLFEYSPESDSYEYSLTKELRSSLSVSDHVNMIKKYFDTTKYVLTFPENIGTIRANIKKCHGNISVAHLAEISGYSVRQVNRIFTGYFGYGPKEYCKLLRFHKTLNEIVYDPIRSNSEFIQNIGYSDQSHFQREFKKLMGETPKQFIRSFLLS